MWFDDLVGFPEESPAQVRENISVDGDLLRSRVNGRAYRYGRLETPSLAELRARVAQEKRPAGRLTVAQVVGEARALHGDPANAGALFQVASQFNLLEMTLPTMTPEKGVSAYEQDKTQGPACAIAAGAGTLYRNYFVRVQGETGQTSDRQIDCLADIGRELGNTDNRLWEMKNGYLLASRDGLQAINQKIGALSESGIDRLRGLLRIGIQWNTEVTIDHARHLVTQAYCSALPVAYCQQQIPKESWAPFARIVLEAAYEATLCAAILNARLTGNNRVYLTLVGGGAFGNDKPWMIDAIRRALSLYETADIQVLVVSYRCPDSDVDKLVHAFGHT